MGGLYDEDIVLWSERQGDLLRRRAKRSAARNPSLRPCLEAILAEAYDDALLIAEREMVPPAETFPDVCPWTVEEASWGDFPRQEA